MSIATKFAVGVASSTVPVLLWANPASAVDVEDSVTTEFTTTLNGQDYTCEVQAWSRIIWSSPNDPEHPTPRNTTFLDVRTVVVPSASCDVDLVLDSVAAGVGYRPEGSETRYELFSSSTGHEVTGSHSVPGTVTETDFFHYVRYFSDDFGGVSGVPASLEVNTDPNPK